MANPRPFREANAVVVLLTLLLASSEIQGQGRPPKTWSDGISDYKSIPPIAGYLVRESVDFQTSPATLLATAKRLSPTELASLTSGGPPLVSKDLLLLEFPNQEYNVVLWQGKVVKDRNVSLRFWNGRNWHGPGTRQNTPDVAEMLFQAPATVPTVMILVSSNASGPLTTESIRFGAFPLPDNIHKLGMQTLDTVVQARRTPRLHETRGLEDCLKGDLSHDEWLSARVSPEVQDGAMVYFSGTGPQARFRFAGGPIHFFNRYGWLDLQFFNLSDGHSYARSLKDRFTVRWNLARESAGPDQFDFPCRLRVVDFRPSARGWIFLEITTGVEQPGPLFVQSQTASRRDGGQSLLLVEVKTATGTKTLRPRSRDRESNRSARGMTDIVAASKVPDPGFDYEFLDCAPGVMKLAIRPLKRPWSGEFQAGWPEPPQPPMGMLAFRPSGGMRGMGSGRQSLEGMPVQSGPAYSAVAIATGATRGNLLRMPGMESLGISGGMAGMSPASRPDPPLLRYRSPVVEVSIP